jgi:hypothetical protein
VSCGDHHTVVSDGRVVFGWGDFEWNAILRPRMKNEDLNKNECDEEVDASSEPVQVTEADSNYQIQLLACGPWSTFVMESHKDEVASYKCQKG